MHQRILILLLASASCLFGQGLTLKNPGYVATLDKANVAAAGGCSYLKCESFEDATTGYDSSNANGWATNSGTAVDPKYTTAILEGTQSLLVDQSSGSAALKLPFTGQADVWVCFMFRWDGTYTGASFLWELQNSSGTRLNGLAGEHGVTKRFSLRTGGSASANDTMPTNTILYIWNHCVKGSGANAQYDFYVSTTTTRPGSPDCTMNTGTWTTDCDRLVLGNDSGDSTLLMKFDHVRVATSDPGSTFPP